jgi:ribonuclease HII
MVPQLREETISFDASYKTKEGALLAGVDEAGRGPLAGPVVCAAVILPDDAPQLLGLNDSKKLSMQERERLSILIKELAISYSVHIQSTARIDETNIYAATRESMEIAVTNLDTRPDIVLADAMKLQVGCKTESIIKGDAQSLAIAAASILAKTARDQLMDKLHEEFPMYNFRKNVGYGTEEHVEALKLHGPCKYHRKTFEPVKSILEGR